MVAAWRLGPDFIVYCIHLSPSNHHSLADYVLQAMFRKKKNLLRRWLYLSPWLYPITFIKNSWIHPSKSAAIFRDLERRRKNPAVVLQHVYSSSISRLEIVGKHKKQWLETMTMRTFDFNSTMWEFQFGLSGLRLILKMDFFCGGKWWVGVAAGEVLMMME